MSQTETGPIFKISVAANPEKKLKVQNTGIILNINSHSNNNNKKVEGTSQLNFVLSFVCHLSALHQTDGCLLQHKFH